MLEFEGYEVSGTTCPVTPAVRDGEPHRVHRHRRRRRVRGRRRVVGRPRPLRACTAPGPTEPPLLARRACHFRGSQAAPTCPGSGISAASGGVPRCE
nr:hypothetical protein [Angustibacter aerolatus]